MCELQNAWFVFLCFLAYFTNMVGLCTVGVIVNILLGKWTKLAHNETCYLCQSFVESTCLQSPEAIADRVYSLTVNAKGPRKVIRCIKSQGLCRRTLWKLFAFFSCCLWHLNTKSPRTCELFSHAKFASGISTNVMVCIAIYYAIHPTANYQWQITMMTFIHIHKSLDNRGQDAV